MDLLNKISGKGDQSNTEQQKPSTGSNKEASGTESGGGGIMNTFNNMAGGGKQGEKNEDALDKGVDLVQERVLGQGKQDNESAAEQAKDEAISDFIRDEYKDTTGTDFPIKDKDKKFG